jgi:hypothetical protein
MVLSNPLMKSAVDLDAPQNHHQDDGGIAVNAFFRLT